MPLDLRLSDNLLHLSAIFSWLSSSLDHTQLLFHTDASLFRVFGIKLSTSAFNNAFTRCFWTNNSLDEAASSNPKMLHPHTAQLNPLEARTCGPANNTSSFFLCCFVLTAAVFVRGRFAEDAAAPIHPKWSQLCGKQQGAGQLWWLARCVTLLIHVL